MYLYVLIVCGSVSLGRAEILFHTDHMEHMHRYYACYFNKYFKLSADENKYEADRDMFVKAKIDAHQKYEERAPTPSCVKWMCDPKMIWDWRKEDKLETWTYFAQPEDKIESWGECFRDEEMNFRNKNYTFSDAGMDFVSLSVLLSFLIMFYNDDKSQNHVRSFLSQFGTTFIFSF